MSYQVKFYCSDKGQHPHHQVGRAGMLSDGGVSVYGGANWGGQGGAVRCRRCGRNLQLSPERWTALMSGLREAGLAELDISDMPF